MHPQARRPPRVEPGKEERLPTSSLGDWHANLLYLSGVEAITRNCGMTITATAGFSLAESVT
jgi:hypothetical protein